MNRQLFLHHYLPAHLASALVAGAMFHFILSESINYPVSVAGPGMRVRARVYSDLGSKSWVVYAAYMVFLVGMFLFIAPLTYGTPGYVFCLSLLGID